METAKKYEVRTYCADEVVWFRKTKEQFGGLSNMASGFPLKVNGIQIFSSEALYQACRFPHLPEVQEKILRERSPMSAKMVGKPFRNESRPDWDEVRVKIMRWCLKVKLAQNFVSFGRLLEITLDKPIVEDSRNDDFWGAIRDSKDKNSLKGTNALGRLLMELRQSYNERRYSSDIFYIEPLNIPDFRIMGSKIESIDERVGFVDLLIRRLYANDYMQEASYFVNNGSQSRFLASEPNSVELVSFELNNQKKDTKSKKNKVASNKIKKSNKKQDEQQPELLFG